VVEGRVEDAGGRAVPGVRVEAARTGRADTTDARGRYRIVFPGTGWVGRQVTLVVAGPGAAEHRVKVTLVDGTVTRDLTLPEWAAADGEREELRTPVAAEAPASVAGLGRRMRQITSARVVPFNTESYAPIDENDFRSPGVAPLSTFSIDVDRASYANVRRFLREGRRPPVDAVRIEELVNYFPYDDPEPTGEHPVAIRTEVAPAPWQPAHRLVRIGLRARSVDTADLPPANLVFLLDVSGSMASPDKLPLLKSALSLLVDQLRARDRVSIVVYAGSSGLVLPPTPGDRKGEILEALERLEAGGSTAGGAGIRLAYRVAAENFVEGGNNRVILATDGDFNVGPSSDAEMVRLIEAKREEGTFLTVLGFGTGNLKDSKMEQIADHGNGNYAYIDSALEARKVLVGEMGGTLLTVAKDVKVQVEFNPRRVGAYRLIGYENRLLAPEDFDDDTRDAGEMGAGHTVTALYEIVPAGVEGTVEVRRPDTLRYRATPPEVASASDELLFVKVRYKAPDGRRSHLLEHPLPARDLDRRLDQASTDLRFAAAVAAWGMILRDSEYAGAMTLEEVARLAAGSRGADPRGYRAEFVRLVEATPARRGPELDGEAGTGDFPTPAVGSYPTAREGGSPL
jgi:Ca-activated chloride channel family protein